VWSALPSQVPGHHAHQHTHRSIQEEHAEEKQRGCYNIKLTIDFSGFWIIENVLLWMRSRWSWASSQEFLFQITGGTWGRSAFHHWCDQRWVGIHQVITCKGIVVDEVSNIYILICCIAVCSARLQMETSDLYAHECCKQNPSNLGHSSGHCASYRHPQYAQPHLHSSCWPNKLSLKG